MFIVNFCTTHLLHYHQEQLVEHKRTELSQYFFLQQVRFSWFYLKQKIISTHFSANNIPTPPTPLSFPTQNKLNLESFPSTNLADAPLHFKSYKPQISTLCLHITSTTSNDWPLIVVPTFHEHDLNFWCDSWLTMWRCSHLTPTLTLGTPSTWWFPVPHSHWTALKTVISYIAAKFLQMNTILNANL